MTCVSIGFVRGDDDVQLLITMNNNDGVLRDDEFEELVINTVALYNRYVMEGVMVWEREDAPDYLAFTESEFKEWTPAHHVDYFKGENAGVQAFEHAEKLATQLRTRVVTSQAGLIGAVARLSGHALPRVAP